MHLTQEQQEHSGRTGTAEGNGGNIAGDRIHRVKTLKTNLVFSMTITKTNFKKFVKLPKYGCCGHYVLNCVW